MNYHFYITIKCLLIAITLFADTLPTPVYQVDTVFVTASRLENNMMNLPVSISLIDKQSIKHNSIGDIASVLTKDNSVFMRNYALINGASQISILGSTSQQVLVLLDGLPINSPSLGTPDLGLIPVNRLRRIEIVKGPISSLYGANAFGGVVNLITENPLTVIKPTIEVSLNYGSYQTTNAGFAYKNSVGNYHFIIDGHYTKTNGLRSNDDGKTKGFGFSSGYNLDVTKNLRFDFQYETKDIGLPGPKPNLSAIPRYGDSTAYSLYDRQSDNLYLTKLIGNWTFSPKFELQVNTRYRANKTDYLSVDQYSFDTTLYLDKYSTCSFNQNIIARYQFNQMRKVVVGYDYSHDWFSAYSKFPIDTAWFPSDSKNGLFSEISFDVLRNIYALINGRFDYHSSFGSFVSPAFGFIWRINKVKFRGHIGRAFRAPTLNDLYWPIYGNKNIKPEIGNAVQIGFDYSNEDNLVLKMTIFSRQTKNLIAWTPDSSGFWRPANVDSAFIAGIELNGKVKIIDGLEFEGSGTIQNGYQVRKEQVFNDWFNNISEFRYVKRKQANLPNTTFTANLNIENHLGTKIVIFGKYVGTRYNYYPSYDSLPKIIMLTKKLPAFVNLSLHINQRLSNWLNLKLIIENLYNTHYAEQFGNSYYDYDYPRPGRSIFAGIEIKK
ncbi:MAG: TonB-dependent receptor plug domain-containing protein [candidate division WOR-3 bacterium]